ncbi:MAG TPA: heavy metal sensor histidine kinase [Chthoniobacterales bacterium]|nr:heavy metal sensor histidine kinase [Chthoniobacterales bacterium]
MSSSNGDLESFRGWSIVARLALLYTVLSTVVLCAAGAFLYWTLVQSLRSEAQSTLADKIAVLRQILRERPEDRNALQEEVEWESTARRQAVYYARLISSGRTIVESPGFRSLLPSTVVFPTAGSTDQSIGTVTEFRAAHGKTFLLTAADVNGAPANEKYRYEIALDISNEQKLLAHYKGKLFIALALAVAISALLSTWVAHRGVRPIREITAAAQAITASALNERISARTWPRELATLATEFDRMLERLEDSFERLSRFSSNIAHELRTPISNLMGETEVALGRSLGAEQYREVLASSLEEYQRLSHLIDSLLFLARAETANLQIHRSDFAAHESISAVMEFYEPLAKESHIELSSTGQARVRGDEPLFRRAISNLLSNSLRHVSPGGKVTVEARTEPAGVIVAVKDNGSGVAPKDLPNLFDRFYRGENARDGVGLGLSIVKSVMGLHHGTIEIVSDLGKGTTVVLRFPLHSE